jgi:hypothetical protein
MLGLCLSLCRDRNSFCDCLFDQRERRYRAPHIGFDTGMFALIVLNDVMRTHTPIPQVVPSGTGGVQLEWHQKGIDLELYIAAPYQCELWF